MSKLAGKIKIEQNLEFIVNVYGDDILKNLLNDILNDLSETGSHYTSKVDYDDCKIDDRETKCYFIKLYVNDEDSLSEKKIESNLKHIAENLMKMYRRDRVYVEVLGKQGMWIN